MVFYLVLWIFSCDVLFGNDASSLGNFWAVVILLGADLLAFNLAVCIVVLNNMLVVQDFTN
jgi:hypothetical protein